MRPIRSIESLCDVLVEMLEAIHSRDRDSQEFVMFTQEFLGRNKRKAREGKIIPPSENQDQV